MKSLTSTIATVASLLLLLVAASANLVSAQTCNVTNATTTAAPSVSSEMTWKGWLMVVAILAVVIVLMLDLCSALAIMFVATLVLTLAGVMSIKEWVSGLANSGVVTVALLYIIAGPLTALPVVKRMFAWCLDGSGSTPAIGRFKVCLLCLILSAFCNNTPLVACSVPVVKAYCRENGIAPSHIMMALNVATIMGGTLALTGSSTNLIFDSMMRNTDLGPMPFFELIKVSGVPAIIVMIYLVFMPPYLIPETGGLFRLMREKGSTFLGQFIILPSCPLLHDAEGKVDPFEEFASGPNATKKGGGDSSSQQTSPGSPTKKTARRSLSGARFVTVAEFIEALSDELRELIKLVQINRLARGAKTEVISPPAPTDAIYAGDILVFSGATKQLNLVARSVGLQWLPTRNLQSSVPHVATSEELCDLINESLSSKGAAAVASSSVADAKKTTTTTEKQQQEAPSAGASSQGEAAPKVSGETNNNNNNNNATSSTAGKKSDAAVAGGGSEATVVKSAAPGKTTAAIAGAIDFVEVVLSPHSPVIGQTVGSGAVEGIYGVSVLAVRSSEGDLTGDVETAEKSASAHTTPAEQQQQEMMQVQVVDAEAEAEQHLADEVDAAAALHNHVYAVGDCLLLVGPTAFVQRHAKDFLVVSMCGEYSDTQKKQREQTKYIQVPEWFPCGTYVDELELAILPEELQKNTNEPTDAQQAPAHPKQNSGWTRRKNSAADNNSNSSNKNNTGEDDVDKKHSKKNKESKTLRQKVLVLPDWYPNLSALVFLAMMAASIGGVDIVISASVAVVAMIVLKLCTLKEAVEAIDFEVYMMIAFSLSLGAAMQNSGLAGVIANGIASVDVGPFPLLLLIGFVCAVMTNTVTNKAASVVLFPPVYALFKQRGYDPLGAVMMLNVIACMAISTNYGFATSLIVAGPAGVAPIDFVKMNLPLNILLVLMCAGSATLVYYT